MLTEIRKQTAPYVSKHHRFSPSEDSIARTAGLSKQNNKRSESAAAHFREPSYTRVFVRAVCLHVHSISGILNHVTKTLVAYRAC